MNYLPRELLGQIVESLHLRDAISLGSTNKQFCFDLSRRDFGYKVTQSIPAHKWWLFKPIIERRPYLIGHFTSFIVDSWNEVSCLPKETMCIYFNICFNESFCNADTVQFPPHMTHLVLGYSFNQNIDDLIINLVQQKITLTHITFGDLFDQSVEKLVLLSVSLQSIIFGKYFKQAFDNIHEFKSLIRLDFGLRTHHSIDLQGLPSLKHLQLGNCNNIRLMKKKFVLPPFLTHLKFGYFFDSPVDHIKLPASLTHLSFGQCFNQPVDKLELPVKLKYLEFGESFDQPVHNLILPESLTDLIFVNSFNQPIDNLKLPLSGSLRCLKFGDEFDQPIDKLKLDLQESLKELDFGQDFNQPVDKLKLPMQGSFKQLSFGRQFNQPIDKLILPSSLIQLKFGFHFKQRIDKLKLPALAHVIFCN